MAEPDNLRLDLAPADHLQRLLQRVPELQEIAEITLIAPWNLDSSDVGPAHWQRLAALIAGHLRDPNQPHCHGVVLIHGTDTLAFCASALAYMLRGLDRPVVLTGSQRPLLAWRTDARANLAAAVECATLDLPEVVVVFGDRVLRGCRATKVDANDYQAFDTPNAPALGHIGVAVDIAHSRVRRPDQPLRLAAELGTGVLALTVFPGLDPHTLDAMFDQASGRVKVLLVRAFGMGNVPMADKASLVPAVARLVQRGLDVVVTTQCQRGRAQLDLYANGRALRDAGAIGAGDMTFEAAVTKAMWALGQPERTVRGWFETDLAGEVTL